MSRGSAGSAVSGQGPHGLQRRISVFWLTLYGLGTTIGAGIYVLVGKVAGEAEMLAPLSFLIAAVVAGMTALSFAELGSRYPKSAGEALYVREGFGSRPLSLAVGLGVAAAGIVSAAAILNGSAGYLREVLALPSALIITALTLLLSAIAFWGIGQSVKIAGIVTLLEIGGLLIIVGAGLASEETREALIPSTELSRPPALGGIMAGALLAFYAFIGFEDMVNVTEETLDVERALPRAIIATLIITTLLYLLVSMVAVSTMMPGDLAASEAPLAHVWEKASGLPSYYLTGIAVIATLNGALVQIIMASRVFYGLADQQVLPALLCRVHSRTHTPWVSTLLAGVLVLLFALALPIRELASLTSLITLAIFALVNLALWRIKSGPQPPGRGHFVLPRIWPIAAFALTVIFAVHAILELF